MPTNTSLPDLQRPAYFDGQRLTAADLAALQSLQQELRWLHNRSMHGWGVVLGCAVTGARGERSVRVSAGYALDCLGRELIIVEDITRAAPPVAGNSNGGPQSYFLTASYRGDSDAEIEEERREGLCDTSGAVRRTEGALLRWQDPADVSAESRFRRGLDVVLASISVQDCKLASDVSTAGRRDALPAERPAVASGGVAATGANWALWPSAAAPIGVSMVVQTGSAAFRVAPRYDARVTGQRFFDGAFGRFVVDGVAHVEQETASSFRLCVLLPAGFTAGPATTDATTERDYMLVVARIVSNPNAWILLGAAAAIPAMIGLFVLGAAPLVFLPMLVAVGPEVAITSGVAGAAILAGAAGVGGLATAAAVAAIAANPDLVARTVRDIVHLVAGIIRSHVGDRLYVGQKLSIQINDGAIGPPVTLSYTIRPSDFAWALDDIRKRNGVATVNNLRALNGMQADNNVAIRIGERLVVSHNPVELNPPAVLTAGFLPRYSDALHWGVEWIGVEG